MKKVSSIESGKKYFRTGDLIIGGWKGFAMRNQRSYNTEFKRQVTSWIDFWGDGQYANPIVRL
jgi:hypothetical protein